MICRLIWRELLKVRSNANQFYEDDERRLGPRKMLWVDRSKRTILVAVRSYSSFTLAC